MADPAPKFSIWIHVVCAIPALLVTVAALGIAGYVFGWSIWFCVMLGVPLFLVCHLPVAIVLKLIQKNIS